MKSVIHFNINAKDQKAAFYLLKVHFERSKVNNAFPDNSFIVPTSDGFCITFTRSYYATKNLVGWVETYG